MYFRNWHYVRGFSERALRLHVIIMIYFTAEEERIKADIL